MCKSLVNYLYTQVCLYMHIWTCACGFVLVPVGKDPVLGGIDSLHNILAVELVLTEGLLFLYSLGSQYAGYVACWLVSVFELLSHLVWNLWKHMYFCHW